MKLALNGASTMKADLETDLRAAQLAGFDFVEIWAAKLRDFLLTRSTSDLRNLFVQYGLKPLSINSIEHITFRTSAAYERIKIECENLSLLAAQVECPYIVVVPGKVSDGGPTRERIIEESVRVLRELAMISGRHGVALAFEFLGQPDCSVQTLGLANNIVNKVARDNVGLVIDSFHFYAGGSTLEMISEVDANRLFIFHINDAEDLPRKQLEDRHRLLPGTGILPLKQMLTAFNRIGYDSVASVEIFRPEYWERDPIKFAQQCKVAVQALL